MQFMSRILLSILLLASLLPIVPGVAQPAERRMALVIGNANYPAGPLATAANDAGLIAQTLQAAGFDVVGARDLDQDSLRRALRDFLDKAASTGPDTVALVYVSGYGLQLEGENYLVPIDARIARDLDVPVEALRISDYLRSLAGSRLRAGVVVLDLARSNPFARTGLPLAGGLALVEPEPGMLIAFNATPGTVAPQEAGPYGSYAQSLAEMIREGGLELGDVFDRVRLRVSDMTGGAQVPWHLSNLQSSFVFFDRAPDAPPPLVAPQEAVTFRTQPIRNFDARDAYSAALSRDTLQGYEEFLGVYPGDPMAKRVRALAAARREAITWRRTRNADTPSAYWSYLNRYPNGPHASDARRRLSFLAAAIQPPPFFPEEVYEVPPPPPEEEIYITRPALAFDDQDLGFAPPPPVYLLPPPPPEFTVLVPPAPPIELYALPDPVYVPVPIWVRPPVYVVAPPRNLIFNDIHSRTIINNTIIINNQGRPDYVIAPGGGRRGAAVAAVALPAFLAQRAMQIQNQNPQFERQRQQLLQQRLQQQGLLQQQQRQLVDQYQQQRQQHQQQHQLLLEQHRQQPQPQQQILEQQRRQQQLLLEQQRQQQQQLQVQHRQMQLQEQQRMLEQQRQHQLQLRQLEQQHQQQQQQERQSGQQQQQRQLELQRQRQLQLEQQRQQELRRQQQQPKQRPQRQEQQEQQRQLELQRQQQLQLEQQRQQELRRQQQQPQQQPQRQPQQQPQRQPQQELQRQQQLQLEQQRQQELRRQQQQPKQQPQRQPQQQQQQQQQEQQRQLELQRQQQQRLQ